MVETIQENSLNKQVLYIIAFFNSNKNLFYFCFLFRFVLPIKWTLGSIKNIVTVISSQEVKLILYSNFMGNVPPFSQFFHTIVGDTVWHR